MQTIDEFRQAPAGHWSYPLLRKDEDLLPAQVAGRLANHSVAIVMSNGVNLVRTAINRNNASALPTGWLTADPLLLALANNGGPAPTMAPLTGSPVIDAAVASGSNLPPTHQRGACLGRAPDLGAYEYASRPGLNDDIFHDGFDGSYPRARDRFHVGRPRGQRSWPAGGAEIHRLRESRFRHDHKNPLCAGFPDVRLSLISLPPPRGAA